MLQTFGCMNKQEMLLERERERGRAGKEGRMRERERVAERRRGWRRRERERQERRARGRWTDEAVTQEWDMKRKDSALGIILLLLLLLSPLSFSLRTGKAARDGHGSHRELCPFFCSLHPSALLPLPPYLFISLSFSPCRRVSRSLPLLPCEQQQSPSSQNCS